MDFRRSWICAVCDRTCSWEALAHTHTCHHCTRKWTYKLRENPPDRQQLHLCTPLVDLASPAADQDVKVSLDYNPSPITCSKSSVISQTIDSGRRHVEDYAHNVSWLSPASFQKATSDKPPCETCSSDTFHKLLILSTSPSPPHLTASSISPLSSLPRPDWTKFVFFIPNPTKKSYFFFSPYKHISLLHLPISLLLFSNLTSSPNPLSLWLAKVRSIPATTACSLDCICLYFIRPSLCRFIPLIHPSLSVFLRALALIFLTLLFLFILFRFSEVRWTSSPLLDVLSPLNDLSVFLPMFLFPSLPLGYRL